MIRKTIYIILILILLLPMVPLCEPEYYPFTKEEVFKIEERLLRLTRNDSIKTIIIAKQNEKIRHLYNIVELDSIEVDLYKMKIELLKERNETPWYDNKILWFIYGAALIVGSSYIVSNIK